MKSINQLSTFLAAALLVNAAYAEQGDDADVIRGVVKAENQAVISAGLKAVIVETPVRTGETFAKGDLLLRFDCSEQNAETIAARAAYGAAKATYENNVELQNFDAVGNFDVKLSKAEMEKAAAQFAAMKARQDKCEIRAPFDGKVAELAINAFETPGVDQPLLKVVGVSALELHLIVPSRWLVWMTPGTSFTFTIDETGETLPAEIVRIGAEVDAVSRTAPIIATFKGAAEGVLPGMSGSASFNPPSG